LKEWSLARTTCRRNLRLASDFRSFRSAGMEDQFESDRGYCGHVEFATVVNVDVTEHRRGRHSLVEGDVPEKMFACANAHGRALDFGMDKTGPALTRKDTTTT
jgi:hypothetical protein